MRKGFLVGAVLAAAACAASVPRVGTTRSRTDEGGRVVRVILSSDARRVAVSATGDWRLHEGAGESILLRGGAGEVWTVERAGMSEAGSGSGSMLRAVRADGVPTTSRRGPFVLRAVGLGAFVTANGRRYRGELRIVARDTGLVVVNRVPLEDYLRGVVPLEMGRRAIEEMAALEAQAVAARSYAFIRLSNDSTRLYDLRASVFDQVYGGVDAETPLTDRAVVQTAGLVLTYGGRTVNAPYSAVCGGTTAAPSEVWHGARDEPFLVPVSDQVPGSDRFYCDPSPRFSWTQTLDSAALASALGRYLSSYVSVRGGTPGTVRQAYVEDLTPTGRVRSLVIITDRDRHTLRKNDIRFVMRTPGGEILNSTYFSLQSELGTSGFLSRLILRGKGYGHGIGMCQWGAIGRARAGQTFRDILRTYYPGTSVETVD